MSDVEIFSRKKEYLVTTMKAFKSKEDAEICQFNRCFYNELGWFDK